MRLVVLKAHANKIKRQSKPFKWKHAAGEAILWLVTWYSRYALSYRDLKEIAAERGFVLDRSTIFAGFKSTRLKSVNERSLI